MGEAIRPGRLPTSFSLPLIATVLDESVVFTELTQDDVKREFARLHPVNPQFQFCVGAKFSNQDFCLIFEE
jgi:hypothetical protein